MKTSFLSFICEMFLFVITYRQLLTGNIESQGIQLVKKDLRKFNDQLDFKGQINLYIA